MPSGTVNFSLMQRRYLFRKIASMLSEKASKR